jgi:hypothetical protein
MCTAYTSDPLEHGKNLAKVTLNPKISANPHMLTHRTVQTIWNDASGNTNVDAQNKKQARQWQQRYRPNATAARRQASTANTTNTNRRRTLLTDGESSGIQPFTILGGR